MSKKERNWLRVLDRVKKKEINLKQAAEIMNVSYRQCLRKNKRYKKAETKGWCIRARTSIKPGEGREDKELTEKLYR